VRKEDIITFLGEDWRKVSEQMREALHTDINLLATTNEGILCHSGKLVRPILTMLTARACAGFCTPDTIRFASAVELLHNATLLHDDVADGSSERRGLPTVNSLLGPRSAVLIGDFWLARAMDKVMEADHFSRKVIKIFSNTLVDLAEGEMLQLEKASTADTTEADYLRIIRCKTASLFGAACSAAAASVDASPEYTDAAVAYADALGMAFQIKDDILDYDGNEELGKPVGIDLMEQKITLPLLGAMKGSPREEELRAKVRDIKEHPEHCAEVRAFVLGNGGVEYASARLDEFIGKAVKALDVFPDGKAKDLLADLARFNALRRV